MNLSTLLKYGVRDGAAELVFEEGARLLFVPRRHGGEVRGLDSILFYRNGSLEAMATAGVRPPDEGAGGFWSQGSMTQAQLASYCEVAVQMERQIYRFYRQKRIDEQTWNERFRGFWKITIKGRKLLAALQEGRMRILNKRPAGFKACI